MLSSTVEFVDESISYGLLSDLHTTALVSQSGSIDWLCLPRFDSPACLASLVGGPENGFWSIIPRSKVRSFHRRHKASTLILETDFATDSGIIRVTDATPPRPQQPRLIRNIEGLVGSVEVLVQLRVCFEYGSILPEIYRTDSGIVFLGGNDKLLLSSSEFLFTDGQDVFTTFEIAEGEVVPFTLSWYPPTAKIPPTPSPELDLRATEVFWKNWLANSSYESEWKNAVEHSLITSVRASNKP